MSRVIVTPNSFKNIQFAFIFKITLLIFLVRICLNSVISYLESHSIYEPENGDTVIIVVTSTSGRVQRLADMTRTANTLRHLKNIHWIVVEDGPQLFYAVDRLLKRSEVNYTYLLAKTPVELNVNRK